MDCMCIEGLSFFVCFFLVFGIHVSHWHFIIVMCNSGETWQIILHVMNYLSLVSHVHWRCIPIAVLSLLMFFCVICFYCFFFCHFMMFLCGFADRSLMAKKADGIKESADSNATIEEEETRGQYQFLCKWHLNTSSVACLWWSVAVSMIHRQGGHWPFYRLSESRCWLTVHQYQSPSARWYVGIHKVSSYDWAVGATPQWPDGAFV